MSIEINGFVFNGITQEQVDYLRNNYERKMTDLEEELGLCDETIKRLLKALEIKRQRLWKRTIPDTVEAINDLQNPYLSHVKIAEKYGCTESAVGSMRKRYGLSVRKVGLTRLEERIVSILDDEDIAYICQKRIDRWSLDFYLGNKIAIDVHGMWSHSKDIQIDRDKRKIAWMKDNGFDYLVILEHELDDVSIVAKKIRDFFWASLHCKMQKIIG